MEWRFPEPEPMGWSVKWVGWLSRWGQFYAGDPATLLLPRTVIGLDRLSRDLGDYQNLRQLCRVVLIELMPSFCCSFSMGSLQ